MRLMISFVLVLLGIVFVHSAPVDTDVDLHGLNSEFDEMLAELADLLPPGQYQAFEQELFQMMANEAAGEVDRAAIELKLNLLLEKYLGQ